MMASLTENPFTVTGFDTPEQIRRKIGIGVAQDISRRQPYEFNPYGTKASNAGAAIGSGLGAGIGAGIAARFSPEVKEAEKRQELFKSVKDLNDPDELMEGAARARKAGDTKLSLFFANRAADLTPPPPDPMEIARVAQENVRLSQAQQGLELEKERIRQIDERNKRLIAQAKTSAERAERAEVREIERLKIAKQRLEMDRNTLYEQGGRDPTQLEVKQTETFFDRLEEDNEPYEGLSNNEKELIRNEAVNRAVAMGLNRGPNKAKSFSERLRMASQEVLKYVKKVEDPWLFQHKYEIDLDELIDSAGSVNIPEGPVSAPLDPSQFGYRESDVEEAMKKHGVTREEVLNRMKDNPWE